MNAYAFDSLHFTSELGTDITVGLVKNHIWAGGNGATPEGVVFDILSNDLLWSKHSKIWHLYVYS